MTTPRFQFTIRGMLWATFWAAVSAAAWKVFGDHDWWPGYEHISLPALLIGLASPFAAVGALFGRTRLGIGTGAIVAMMIFLAQIVLIGLKD